ncbi:hypothetical protein BHR43_17535 [Aeromonas salmonicida subsp. salmonicida]|uniref:Uncharacterized protein n=1 Tax=Aeromonas phage vB_AsaM_LPM4 TaxID=2894367 RepID=A0AAE8YIR1_9CAUD|nr:hypothetical protein [Aeromonas salmonicida]YP_010664488.1 hypothetical protein PQA71_gp46 [Aeromonas phage vB_AsaM_LPM4]ELY1969289.1 hypothetical protein [Aeromonas salmonicida]ELY2000739.1 hypothetical protein [Aeromonas salmonicida]KHE97351.1 hypothetical protein NX85_17460 [Aeromonas salmonicida subsp. salmonicida]KHE98632.1 hypothetical protein NV17_08055 [Aeromonas salmonicida subsp. salmonicida]MCR4453793.1 hypothetical protein [Aeromonas salmonicida]
MNTAKVIALVQQPSAADAALADMRAKFGRNGAASRWSRLPTRARAVICYAAGISPSAASQELDQFEFDQQEALRLALSDLLATLREFDGAVLHRREWHRTASRVDGPTRSELEQAALENQRRAELSAQAGTLESRLAALRKVAGNGQ